MQSKGMMIPLITSVGVGAATYYSMTKNQQNFGQTMEKMVPLVSQLNGGGSSQGMSNGNQGQQINANNSTNGNNTPNQNTQQFDQQSMN